MVAGASRVHRHDVSFGAYDVAVDDAVDSADDSVGDRAVGVFPGVTEDVQLGNAAYRRRKVPTSWHVVVGEMLDAGGPLEEFLG